MRSEVITVRTRSYGTSPGEAAKFVAAEADGQLHVFVPHATAGLAIIETGAGSDEDLLAAIDQQAQGRRYAPGAAAGPARETAPLFTGSVLRSTYRQDRASS